jgi:hypothetical protein
LKIYIVDEDDNYLKLVVIGGNPFGIFWTSKVFIKDNTGNWVFMAKSNFEYQIRSGVVLTVKGKDFKVKRYFIQNPL